MAVKYIVAVLNESLKLRLHNHNIHYTRRLFITDKIIVITETIG